MRVTAVGILSAATVALVPFLPRLGLLNGAVSVKALFLIAAIDVIVITFAFLSLRDRDAYPRPKGKLSLALLLLAAVYAGAALFGLDPIHSFFGDVSRSTGLFLLFHLGVWAYVLSLVASENDWSLIRRSILFSAALFSLLTILGAGGLGYEGKFLWFTFADLGITFGNDTFAGAYLLLAAGIGAIEVSLRKKDALLYQSLCALAVIALSPILLTLEPLVSGEMPQDGLSALLGSARASSIAFWALAAFTLSWWGMGKVSSLRVRKVLQSAVVAVFVGVVGLGLALLLIPGSPVQNALRDETTEARFITWDIARSAISERPLLGWGPENFDRAFEANFDARLYEKEGLVEVWFDRAHNVLFDTATTSGILGVLACLIVLGVYARAVLYARLPSLTTALLLALPVAHIVQLQTAFDVVSTYALMALLLSYGSWLEGREAPKEVLPRALLIGAIGVALVSLATTLVYELPRQLSLVGSLSEQRQQKRAELISFGLSRTSDFEGLHRTSIHFSESVFDELLHSADDAAVEAQARPYLAQYMSAYEAYLTQQPDHYRARMNYAYLLLLNEQWGAGRGKEALPIIEGSYALSPNNPLTYVLHIMALVYADNLVGAKAVYATLAERAPGIDLTRDAENWLKKQERNYPERSFLRIGNI